MPIFFSCLLIKFVYVGSRGGAVEGKGALRGGGSHLKKGNLVLYYKYKRLKGTSELEVK